jgi:hypothetical protein
MFPKIFAIFTPKFYEKEFQSFRQCFSEIITLTAELGDRHVGVAVRRSRGPVRAVRHQAVQSLSTESDFGESLLSR